MERKIFFCGKGRRDGGGDLGVFCLSIYPSPKKKVIIILTLAGYLGMTKQRSYEKCEGKKDCIIVIMPEP